MSAGDDAQPAIGQIALGGARGSGDMRRINENFPVIYREPLMLQAIGGFSGNEIAQILDIPRATVNTGLFRARAHLRQRIESQALVLAEDRESNG